jgi:membrane protease YdiL (CAAX protease family)
MHGAPSEKRSVIAIGEGNLCPRRAVSGVVNRTATFSSWVIPQQASTRIFVLATFAVTWILLAPAVLSARGVVAGPAERYLLPALLATFVPLAVAALVVRHEVPRGRRLFASFAPHVAPAWYAVALGLFPAIYAAGAALYGLCGGTSAHGFYPPDRATDLAALIVVPIVEEPAWRGFAFSRLLRRWGGLRASLGVGIIWALYLASKEIALTMASGPTPISLLGLALFVTNITLASVVFGWIYLRTRGSMLAVILAHASDYFDNPFRALPESVTPVAIDTVAMTIVVFTLVLADRRVWRERVST